MIEEGQVIPVPYTTRRDFFVAIQVVDELPAAGVVFAAPLICVGTA